MKLQKWWLVIKKMELEINMAELIELSLEDGKKVYDMLQDIESEENRFHNSAKGLTFAEFKDYLIVNKRMAKGINLKEGYVPQTIYWLWIDDKPVGMAKLRHYLNENLREKGGHAAYAVRKSERGRGYGKLILKELTTKAKEMDIEDLLLTVDDVNITSRKVIEANGGELEKIKDGECYYWIKNI